MNNKLIIFKLQYISYDYARNLREFICIYIVVVNASMYHTHTHTQQPTFKSATHTHTK